ncbi:hypothetical protein HOK51_04975 [Candidatus Woesearchaeota archaeon]|jgi:hypothetical protein|nr:hypothetical protein [Candidatus Woesearchaeota archaeon]MBT6519179.1 hypothetical protein [Candidatus Woesearchaeota archaeon]MBT7368676.1 hypothetical protein [Candidatus Woesearchaeota archaeon]
MNRSISDTNILKKFAEEFCNIVEKHVKYIIVSGFVAISSGRVRGTEDIDMIISKIDLKQFQELHQDLINNEFVCMQSEQSSEIYEYLSNNTSVRYTWKNKFLPEMEIKFVKDDLDQEQIITRTKIKFTGMNIWFSKIEYNIAFKEEYLKSEKDLEDAKHLRLVYSDELDEEEINRIKKNIRQVRL